MIKHSTYTLLCCLLSFRAYAMDNKGHLLNISPTHKNRSSFESLVRYYQKNYTEALDWDIAGLGNEKETQETKNILESIKNTPLHLTPNKGAFKRFLIRQKAVMNIYQQLITVLKQFNHEYQKDPHNKNEINESFSIILKTIDYANTFIALHQDMTLPPYFTQDLEHAKNKANENICSYIHSISSSNPGTQPLQPSKEIFTQADKDIPNIPSELFDTEQIIHD